MDATSKTPRPMVPLRTASSVARPVARSPSSSVFSATFRAATRAAGATAFTCISNTLAPMHGHSTRAGGVRGTAARLTDRFVAGNGILRAYRRRTTAAANSRVDAPPSRSRSYSVLIDREVDGGAQTLRQARLPDVVEHQSAGEQ